MRGCSSVLRPLRSPHVEAGAGVVGVFAGEVFFGGEEDLGAVGGHADVVDGGGFVGGRAFGDLVGGGVVDAHVEVDGGSVKRGQPGPSGISAAAVAALGVAAVAVEMRMWEPSVETAGKRRNSSGPPGKYAWLAS